MATVNYYILGKKNPSNIYCRFSNSRSIDIYARTNIFVNPQYWDKKHQKIRNVTVITNRDKINKKLSELKIHVIDEFNLDFMYGEIIDRGWLEEKIQNFFKRPKGEQNNRNENHKIYYIEFARWWMEEKAPIWLTSSNKFMTKRARGQNNSFIEQVNDFLEGKKLKIKDTSYKIITDYSVWMNQNGYAEKTTKRQIGRFKFFLLRAKEEGIAVDDTFTKRVFVPKTEDVLEPILDPSEIQKIYSLDLSKNKVLENARDNLIIACWTGLRISDFLNKLDLSNFIDDFIEITTTKTQTSVVIPVHPMIKRILIKNKGKLPKKVNDADFNKQIKEVCYLANLKKEMKGRVYDTVTKRKVVGLYKKYELVTSHIGRRSFATNHFGKLPNSLIMGICGWSKEDMMLKYIKKSNREHAEKLKEYWDKNYQTI